MTPLNPTTRRAQPRNLLGVLAFLGKYRFQVGLCVSLLLVNIAIEMALPQIIGGVMTRLEWFAQGGARIELSAPVQLFIALVLIRAGVGLLLGPIRNRVIQGTLGDLRSAIYDAIQRLAFQYHDKVRTGELISRSTTDIFRLQDFLFACLFLSVDIAVSLVVTVILIFLIHPQLGVLTLATLVPTIALIAFYSSRLQPRWRNVDDLHASMTTVIQENIAGVRVVKAFAREESEIVRFRGRKDEFMNTLMQTVNYWAARVPFAQFIFGLSLPLILWAGGRLVISGTIPIGDLAKVVLYIMAIGHRVGMVGQFTNIIQHAGASAERILEVIREPQGIRSGPLDLPPGRGDVRFEHVRFQYGDARASLEDVSFEVKPGQTVAIVGPTGSGKTTLVNLIPRFYDVTGGSVSVDGVDVRKLKLDQLRRGVSVIFQETFLFSASVADNIAYGNPTASREDVERAARAAQAHDFILELESGYDTIIGERGISLSGGQRQRIAIARAFLMNPRILILDDATASVDSRTERMIQEAMRRLCEGRTTFVIAQRASSVQHADLVLVLKEGRIVERGAPSELLRQGGLYCDLFNLQPAGGSPTATPVQTRPFS